MRKDAVYQLLATRFCHDLASPINAAGLLLEAGLEGETQSLAQHNHANLVSILRLYRLMFSYRPNEDILGRVLEAIREACCLQRVESDIRIADPDSPEKEIPSSLLKALVVVFYGLMPHLSEHDGICLVSGREDGRQEAVSERPLDAAENWQGSEDLWFPKAFHKADHSVRLQKRLELRVETGHPLTDFLLSWSASIERADPSSQDALPLFLEFVLTESEAFGALQQHNEGLQTTFAFYEVQRA